MTKKHRVLLLLLALCVYVYLYDTVFVYNILNDNIVSASSRQLDYIGNTD